MWSELVYLHKQHAFVSSLYQSYVRDMIHFSRQRTDNWVELEGPVLKMPADPASFE